MNFLPFRLKVAKPLGSVKLVKLPLPIIYSVSTSWKTPPSNLLPASLFGVNPVAFTLLKKSVLLKPPLKNAGGEL